MKKYFKDCKTLNELKSEYRKLAMENHPDLGGDAEVMKAINAEYDEVFKTVQSAWNAENPDKASTEAPEEFREVLSKLFKLGGIVIELCGCWLWIGGETKKHAKALKEAGCRWSAYTQKWYWRHWVNGMYYGKHEPYSMNTIRRVYGSSVLTEEERKALTA